MAYVAKVSKTGEDVGVANVKDLLFYSEHSTLKIVIDEKHTINNATTKTIPHSLSYTPMFMVFGANSAGDRFPIGGFVTLAGPSAYAWADGTNVYVRNNDGAARSFRVFVFIDRLV